jgi:uroporphyrinogen-III synthase
VRKLLLLRPEPGLSASARRAHELGLEAVACPLFAIEPVAWLAGDAAAYDALLLTSANAIWQAGPELQMLKGLPAYAVGPETAAAAEAAGIRIEAKGRGSVIDLVSKLPPSLRLLHLTGEDHRDPGHPNIDRRIIYRSVPIEDPPLPPIDGFVVAVHSPRAGRRLSELVEDRGTTAVAAISHAAAQACGSGWERVEAAPAPNDKSLLALAAMLCHTSRPQ